MLWCVGHSLFKTCKHTAERKNQVRTERKMCYVSRFQDLKIRQCPCLSFKELRTLRWNQEKMRQDLSVCTFHNAVRAPPYQTSSDNRSNAQSFKTSQIKTFRECKFQKSLHACPTKVHAASRHQARIHRHGLLLWHLIPFAPLSCLEASEIKTSQRRKIPKFGARLFHESPCREPPTG